MQLTLKNLTKLVLANDMPELKKHIQKAKELSEKTGSIIEEQLEEVIAPVPSYSQACHIHLNQVYQKFYSGIGRLLENEDITDQEKAKRLEGLFELKERVSEGFVNTDFLKGYKEGYNKSSQFHAEPMKRVKEVANKVFSKTDINKVWKALGGKTIPQFIEEADKKLEDKK